MHTSNYPETSRPWSCSDPLHPHQWLLETPLAIIEENELPQWGDAAELVRVVKEMGYTGVEFAGTVLDAPAEKEKFIEIIGDSISNGYGVLGNYSQGDGSALWSDATQAYNFLTAQALNADFSNPSWSGLGCKYGYSSITMQDVYPAQRYNFDKTTPYSFDKEPNIVVLALGTNDNSIQSNATLKREGLVEMLTLVREKNPTAPIVWIHGMMTNGVSSMIEEIVAEFGLAGGVAKLADGTLAGSATNLYDCMKNAILFGIPECDAVRASTYNPACSLGVQDQVGSIATGKLADFIVCRNDYTGRRVFLAGKEI